jgi:hypothetical protein
MIGAHVQETMRLKTLKIGVSSNFSAITMHGAVTQLGDLIEKGGQV